MKMNLTPREQKVLLLAGCALVAILVYLAVDSALQRYRDLDRDIALQTEELTKVSRLREQYVQTHAQLETIQAKLAGQKNTFSLLSFIEDLAKKENIREKIGSVKPKTLPLNDQYDENMLELQVDDITLVQLVDFIYQIEHSGPVLKVKRLRIKSRYNDRNLLNVTMQVTTFTQKG
jgi:type II secretory pathway component PulM